ncbi:MAG: hypothetical protein ABI451_10330, partial [Dokdonella sp.]
MRSQRMIESVDAKCGVRGLAVKRDHRHREIGEAGNAVANDNGCFVAGFFQNVHQLASSARFRQATTEERVSSHPPS